MIPEVATYMQSFKNFLKNNQEARMYFLSGIDEDLFFEHFEEIAEKNYKKSGDAMLNKNQLEELRLSMLEANVVKERETKIPSNIFVEVPNFGFYCLN
jgi:hypothetical protein